MENVHRKGWQTTEKYIKRAPKLYTIRNKTSYVEISEKQRNDVLSHSYKINRLPRMFTSNNQNFRIV